MKSAFLNKEKLIAIGSSGWPSGLSSMSNNEWNASFDGIVNDLIESNVEDIDLTVIFGAYQQANVNSDVSKVNLENTMESD